MFIDVRKILEKSDYFRGSNYMDNVHYTMKREQNVRGNSKFITGVSENSRSVINSSK